MNACAVQGLASPRTSGRPSTLHQGRSLRARSLSSTSDTEPEDNPVSPHVQVRSFEAKRVWQGHKPISTLQLALNAAEHLMHYMQTWLTSSGSGCQHSR